MSLPVDPGTGIPTSISEYDGFDVAVIDSERWETPTIVGATTIAQAGGLLVFTNTGAGLLGKSYYETKRKFGKNWRITTDLKLETTTGTSGEISLVLWRSPTCYFKIGPYKGGAIDCNCYLRWRNGAAPEAGVALTGDAVDPTTLNNYTISNNHDTILLYYKGILLTSMPCLELYNFTIRIEAGTGANADTLLAKANDYEILNVFDPLLMTIGQLCKATYDKVGTSIVTDLSGTLNLHDTTEHFITLAQATYGTKFRVNLFADLEGVDIHLVEISDAGGAKVDITDLANSLTSNNIRLCTAAGAQVNDAIYFESDVKFRRLDVYMEGGTSNTTHTYVWEWFKGGIWEAVALTATLTDGTSYGGKVFGKSGSVTWDGDLTIPTGMTHYAIRARITVAGASLPKATHIQISEDAATGFDSNAAFLSNLLVRIYRKNAAGNYASLPADMALPFTQCILYRNVELANLPAWTDIKIGFKLSAAPITAFDVTYTGFIETLQT